MFVLTKPVSNAERDSTPDIVSKSVAPLAFDIEETESSTTYRISGFSPFLRYSMFGPFSEVTLERIEGAWLLKLCLSKTLLFPFAAAVFAVFIFRMIGPIGPRGLLMIFGVPTLVVGLGIAEARMRVGMWWRSI
jgi:hypothetical protein